MQGRARVRLFGSYGRMAKAGRVAALSALWAMAAGGASLVRLLYLLRQTEAKKMMPTGGSPRRVLVLCPGASPRVIGLPEQAGHPGRGDSTGERRR